MFIQHRPRPRTLLAGAAVFLALAACREEQAAQPRQVVRPVKLMVVSGAAAGAGAAAVPGAARSFPGRVEAANQVDLSFRVGGPLVELPVKEGQRVGKGELLARIDPRDFEIRLKSARAHAERTEADRRRYAALYEKSAISEAQLDQAQAAFDVAEAALEDAEADLADSVLRAPFAGVIGETFIENFQDVRPREPILSLVDVSRVKVVVDLPEFSIARLRRDTATDLFARFDVAPDRDYPLELEELAAQADPRTQTYSATLLMDQPRNINVLPGMTANVFGRAATTDSQARAVVPAVAVFADEAGASYVWVVDSATMKVARRAVTTGGLTGSDSIEIEGGLAPGETIAVSAVSQLSDGLEVRSLTEAGAVQ